MQRRAIASTFLFTFGVACGGGQDPLPSPGDPGSGGGGGFVLRGQVAAVATSGRGLQAAQSAPSGSDRRVTDIIAFHPSSLSPERRHTPVGADGSFELSLSVGRPWLLELVDRNQVGSQMVVSVFQAETLDALVPTSSGTLELGMISTTSSVAETGVGYDQLLATLGLLPADALALGAVDDLCLRYVNPDVDGNGTLDLLEPEVDFRLDLHVWLQTRLNGRLADVSDLVGRYFDPAETSIEHQGTALYSSFRRSYSAAPLPGSGEVRFDEPVHLMSFGPSGTQSHVMPADAAITGSDLTVLDYGEMRSLGVVTQPGPTLPQGRYRFGVGASTLTFTEVHTRTGAELMAASGFVLPFLRFDPVDPNCTSDCAIASVSYRWMRHSAGAWTEATAAERALFVDPAGGHVSVRYGRDNAPNQIDVEIPVAEASGTIPWAAAHAHVQGLSEAEFMAMTTQDVCHLGLSVDDLLGMRYFLGVQNAPGTCH